MSHVLVTGATGFVGRHLSSALLERGDRVTALVRASSDVDGLRDDGVRLVTGDLATGTGLAEAVRGVDRVFHLAALVASRDPGCFYRVNAGGTLRLVRALARLPEPPRLVLCSSLSAAGPVTADGAARGPVSEYGRSKLAAELVARRHPRAVPTAIVRPPVVYGRGDAHFLPSLLPMVRFGVAPSPAGPEQRCSLLHVDDLCSVLTAVASRGGLLDSGDPRAGLYEPSDGEEYTWRDVLAALAADRRRPVPRTVRVPAPVLDAAARLSEGVGRVRGHTPILNRDKVRELRHSWLCTPTPDLRALGFSPDVSLRRGISRTLTAASGRT